ncbi:MAG: M1 family aminopeptidase, partial [Salegentibacter sp.]
ATYGKEKLDEKLREERQKVISFSKTTHTPVIDTSRTDYMKLLNANSYQKGAWFLHMLRRKVGDENFWQAIRKYYEEYELSNATTEDLQKVFENVSGQKLQNFFDQWLRQYGQPVLKTNWKYTNRNLEFEVLQQQQNDFEFPLEVKFEFADGSSVTRTFQVRQKKQKFRFSIDQKPVKVKLDPEVNLLFEKALS